MFIGRAIFALVTITLLCSSALAKSSKAKAISSVRSSFKADRNSLELVHLMHETFEDPVSAKHAELVLFARVQGGVHPNKSKMRHGVKEFTIKKKVLGIEYKRTRYLAWAGYKWEYDRDAKGPRYIRNHASIRMAYLAVVKNKIIESRDSSEFIEAYSKPVNGTRRKTSEELLAAIDKRAKSKRKLSSKRLRWGASWMKEAFRTADDIERLPYPESAYSGYIRHETSKSELRKKIRNRVAGIQDNLKFYVGE